MTLGFLSAGQSLLDLAHTGVGNLLLNVENVMNRLLTPVTTVTNDL